MHPAAFAWVEAHTQGLWSSVCEVGSRDVNGSVRELICCDEYVGCDLSPGPGVDVVCDARSMIGLYDLVVCCEALEHDADPRSLISALGRLCKPGGRVVCTAAGTGRVPHSAVDGGPLRDGEHYGNLDASMFDVGWGRTVVSELADGDWRVVWSKYDRY